MGAYKRKLLLFCVFFIALFLRLYGTNWDQGWHLHPDERFLTMVGIDVKIPPTLGAYLDQHISTFNPVNNGHTFFVYGTFPILVNKVLAQFIYNDTYDLAHLQGRVLSAGADFLVVLLLFKLVELIEKKMKFAWYIKYLTAFFYGISVLPIQLSHFFTVDTFLNLFCWLSLYFAVALYTQPFKPLSSSANISLSGLFLGLALACKVSGLYFAPLIGFFILLGIWKRGRGVKFVAILLFIICGYIALRLGSPYYFETGKILNPQLSRAFISSIQTLKSFDNPEALFPPSVQWLSKSYEFPLKNIIFFGIGPVTFLLALGGLYQLLKKRNSSMNVSILWVLFFLVYQSFQFAKTMRYLIFLYPFLALFAAVGIEAVFNIFKKSSLLVGYVVRTTIVLLIIIWPVAFMSIYTKHHSRVAASRWIYENIPGRSIILTEYWDDPLPLSVYDPQTKNYIGKEVHIFDPDTQAKWIEINKQLTEANYYVMSSNRGWGSIGEVPDRYPVASQFYNKMKLGQNGYTLVKTFTSFPSLRYLGIPVDFPDQWAEEAFTVYDHPEVMIFKKK